MLDIDERLDEATSELRAQLANVDLAPVSTVVHRLHRRRGVGAVAALLAVVGVVGVAVAATRDDASVASVTTHSSQQSPVTSAAALPTNMTTPTAEAWRSIVEAALRDANWSLTLDTVYENVSAPGGRPWATAVATVGGGRIVFEVDPFADGEFQSDSVWQMGVAGATSPGIATPEGTLFTVDYPATPVRRCTIVALYGIVMVHAEMIPTSALPDVAVFSSVAAALARGAGVQLYSSTGT